MRFEHVDIKQEKFKKLYHNLTARYYLHVIAVPLCQCFREFMFSGLCLKFSVLIPAWSAAAASSSVKGRSFFAPAHFILRQIGAWLSYGLIIRKI